MLRSYFIVALRNIVRNKTYSLINVFGLSIGVACCLLLALYIQDEMSYDQHHHRAKDIYRITSHFKSDKGLDDLATCSPPIAWGIKDEVPEIETVTRVLNPPGVSLNLFRYGDNTFYESNGFLADSTLFDVFTYEFLEGNPQKALVEANSVVLTQNLARKLFGDKPALNNLVFISQGGPSGNYRVTGVLKETPTHSIIDANFFTSMTSEGWGTYMRSPQANDEWAGQNFVPSYVKLKPNHNKAEVVRKMNEVFLKHGADDMKALGLSKTLGLEPLRDIYLKSAIGRSPRIIYIYVIASIASFILLIACINFMNLSTAKATKRAAEIGLRKMMGAYRSSLIRQILGEAMVIVLISILFSIGFVQLALPFFNELTSKTISFTSSNAVFFAVALAVITLATGLMAGGYPAFYLSSFEPARVLKGKPILGNATSLLRRSLVVFQFVIAIALVCGMIIIGAQLNFMQQSSLGFDSAAKIVLPLRTKDAQDQYASLVKVLSAEASVKKVSGADYLPGSYIWSDFGVYTQGSNMDRAILHRVDRVDHGYLELMGIQLLAGRSFTDNRELEGGKTTIINRLGAQQLGFTPESAIGQKLYTEFQGERTEYEIIGVMEDFHQVSLREKIYPVLFLLRKEPRYDYIVANVGTQNFNATIGAINGTWKKLISDTPFEYSFLDESIQKQYDEDKRVSRIISSFTAIALLISCMGLYGLSTYMTERRFKEIGVRKVLGASVPQIVALMSREFIKLVLIAFAISVPLAWYAMDKWLEGFAYKIAVNGMVFVYAGASAMMIALLTVSFESIKAAIGNPVESLRNE